MPLTQRKRTRVNVTSSRRAGKQNSLFGVRSIRFGGAHSNQIHVRASPTNYEKYVEARRNLQNFEGKNALQRFREEYRRAKQRKETITIPRNIPLPIGVALMVSIGGKFLVFAQRSNKVRTYPGKFHTIGGMAETKGARLSDKQIRKTARSELETELGIRGRKVKLGERLGINTDLNEQGLGINVFQEATVDTVSPTAFISKHFVPLDPKRPERGFVLRREAGEAWEASRFVIIPQTKQGVQKFSRGHGSRMTPGLKFALRKLLEK